MAHACNRLGKELYDLYETHLKEDTDTMQSVAQAFVARANKDADSKLKEVGFEYEEE